MQTTYGTHLANNRAVLLVEIMNLRYDGTGILEYQSKMDTIRLKLLEAGHIIKNEDYLSMFMSTLSNEFDIMSTTMNYELDTVETIVNKLRQIEIRKDL